MFCHKSSARLISGNNVTPPTHCVKLYKINTYGVWSTCSPGHQIDEIVERDIINKSPRPSITIIEVEKAFFESEYAEKLVESVVTAATSVEAASTLDWYSDFEYF